MRKQIIWMCLLGFVVGCQPTAVIPTQTPISVTATVATTPEAEEPTEESIIEVEETAVSTPERVIELTAVPLITNEEEKIEEIMPAQTPEPLPSSPGEADLVQQAITDLSQRLSVSESMITLMKYENVVWPDAGLGCPHPDMAYTQVQRDGYRILLQYGKRTFAYHGGGNRGPFLCENKAAGNESVAPSPGFDE